MRSHCRLILDGSNNRQARHVLGLGSDEGTPARSLRALPLPLVAVNDMTHANPGTCNHRSTPTDIGTLTDRVAWDRRCSSAHRSRLNRHGTIDHIVLRDFSTREKRTQKGRVHDDQGGGKEFNGFVNSLVKFGLFVELDGYFIAW